MDYLVWFLAGGVLAFIGLKFQRFGISFSGEAADSVADLLKAHFKPLPVKEITITERQFPFRVRADLQKAIDELFGTDSKIVHFFGVRREYSHEGLSLSECLVESTHNPAVSVPPEHEELDVGDEQLVRVLKNGLWMLEKDGMPYAVLLSLYGQYGCTTGFQFQIGTANSAQGTQLAQEFFKRLEDSILRADSYRGKILSLEKDDHSYTGESSGITVHKLRQVERDQVILPESTIALLERNVIGFVRQRERLAQFNQSTKKGLLFYGPPGTGKTHTIHYLSRALEGHTTLLISAEQVGLLGDYMTLARLLQPSIVVMEDVDLIARNRTEMNSVCEEVMLNRLLNEMDGLKEDADILFVLTTNRPEALEAALASRPGRIDQAIEFPLPDQQGRSKLVKLYSQGVSVDDVCVNEIVRRTDGVSAAFMKELMRRIVQCNIERDGDGSISKADIDGALDEMLFKGGSLNLKLLGASAKLGETEQTASR
ncbi:ATP-binding protein [Stieleria sp. JC731]|uniref:AAA family ATPase n=1 Tax=Pirellulaceae TaxID=2691357 RepID=UPI001E556385|nr:ATP-binding protein [Stieleria sp. JC731]MCC9602166.1 ATP-binding protein [Stieleria sp. JC731]